MMKFTTKEYDSAKHILAIPDHYVAIARTAAKATAASGMVVSKNGRFIIKAGTVYPANNETAIGLVMQDYDVTDSDASMAIIIHGFVRADRLPETLSETAKSVLPQITVIATITGSKEEEGDQP